MADTENKEGNIAGRKQKELTPSTVHKTYEEPNQVRCSRIKVPHLFSVSLSCAQSGQVSILCQSRLRAGPSVAALREKAGKCSRTEGSASSPASTAAAVPPLGWKLGEKELD